MQNFFEVCLDPPTSLLSLSNDEYVTFIGTNETGRQDCLKTAIDQNMGSWDAVSHLHSQLGPYKYLLQIFRIDETVTTIKDFTNVAHRIVKSGIELLAPPVIDVWCSSFLKPSVNQPERLVYGFCLMHKPDISIAEMIHEMADIDQQLILNAIQVTSPFVKNLAERIIKYNKCDLGKYFNAANIGLFTSRHLMDIYPNYSFENTTLDDVVYAVVCDWSMCKKHSTPLTISSVIPPYFHDLQSVIMSSVTEIDS